MLKPEYFLEFNVPEIPKVGDYISIQRPDRKEPFGEDLVVRQVWWRLNHPDTDSVVYASREKIGGLTEVFVECDQAIGPYSSNQWRDTLEAAENQGIEIPRMEAERFVVRESDLI